MNPPLTDERVAELVSHVTQTMIGMKFSVAPVTSMAAASHWRSAVLKIGDGVLTVALSSDQPGCTVLGAALFSCAAASVDFEMMEDSLRELVNMCAGKIKAALMLDLALGLPRVEANCEKLADGHAWRVVPLRGPSVDLLVWITDSPGARP